MQQSLATFDLVLFGGTGDLAMRKLLPALYRRSLAGQISRESRIVGVGRSSLSSGDYLALVEETCRKYLGKEFDAKCWEQFARQVRYAKFDVHSEADFALLRESLEGRQGNVRVFFLSTAPDLFASICEGLSRQSLVTPNSRVVLEKPLGHDRESSRQINERVGSIFS